MIYDRPNDIVTLHYCSGGFPIDSISEIENQGSIENSGILILFSKRAYARD